MQFQVPKFLERESKIFLSLSFKQLFYFIAGGIVLFILYFILPMRAFLFALFLIFGGAFSLIFIKFDGLPLSQMILQSFGFFSSKRTYLWQKKETFARIKLTPEKKEEKKKLEEPRLKLAPETKLQKLASRIEIGLR
ncbi:MAG: PrgI family protein [Patescibacteria group bacterium]|nr:PrgI family protein [Patescibacteria group bacterium]